MFENFQFSADKKLNILQCCNYGQLAKLQMSHCTVWLHIADINEPKNSLVMLMS